MRWTPMRWAAMAVVLLLGWMVRQAWGQGARPARTGNEATKPATRPAVGDAAREAKKAIEYLEKEYRKKLESPDWRQRALAVISLARLPQGPVTAKLLEITARDRNDVVRLLAWQGVLARAASLSAREYQQWMNATLVLGEKGAFRGNLRPQLLAVLATARMNARSRAIFERLATETNAWASQDVATLAALGRTLSQWRNMALAEGLVRALTDENACVRVEYILQNANLGVSSARERLPETLFNPQAPGRLHPSSQELWAQVQADYVKALASRRGEWARPVPTPEAWKRLGPGFLPAPYRVEELEAKPSLWKADLELGSTNLRSFEVAFVVDATGSMGDVHEWLSRDILRLMSALGAVSQEPRMGLTFYRDRGEAFVTRHLPLTTRGEELVTFVGQTGAQGGGDVAEAVLAGLRDALEGNRWTAGKTDGKVLVLIGDAPPHAAEVAACVELVKAAAGKGVKTYVAKVQTVEPAAPIAAFDQIAAAAGTTPVDVKFLRPTLVRFFNPDGKEEPLKNIPRPEAQLLVAPAPDVVHSGEKILLPIIADAINPQYRDRLEPLVKTLLAYCEQPPAKETRKAFPANTPSLEPAKNIKVQ